MKRKRTLWEELSSFELFVCAPAKKEKIRDRFLAWRDLPTVSLLKTNPAYAQRYFMPCNFSGEADESELKSLSFSANGRCLAVTKKGKNRLYMVQDETFSEVENNEIFKATGESKRQSFLFPPGLQDEYSIQRLDKGRLNILRMTYPGYDESIDLAQHKMVILDREIVNNGVFSLVNPHEFILAAKDGYIHSVNVLTGESTSVKLGDSQIISLSPAFGEDKIAVSFEDGSIEIIAFNRTPGIMSIRNRETLLSPNVQGETYTAAFSPQGNYFVQGSSRGIIKIYFRTTLGIKLIYEEYVVDPITCFAFSADEEYLAWGTHKGNISIVALKDDKYGYPHKFFNNKSRSNEFDFPIESLVFSPDKRWFVAITGEGLVDVWRSYASLSKEDLEQEDIPLASDSDYDTPNDEGESDEGEFDEGESDESEFDENEG